MTNQLYKLSFAEYMEMHQAERDCGGRLHDDETSRRNRSSLFTNYSRVSTKENSRNTNCNESEMRNRTRRDAGHFETRVKNFGERENVPQLADSICSLNESQSPPFSIVCLVRTRLTCGPLYTIVLSGETQTTLLFGPV